jgi:hypothetical protein
MLSSLTMNTPLRYRSASFLLGPAIIGALAAPANAAAFAGVNGSLFLFDFSQPLIDLETKTNTNTSTASSNGTAFADSIADAFASNSFADSYISMEVGGYDGDFSALANGEAMAGGEFAVQPEPTLSFQFLGSLELYTEIDNPESGSASARGDLGWSLVDDSSPDEELDSLLISALLQTSGDEPLPSIHFGNDQPISLDFCGSGDEKIISSETISLSLFCDFRQQPGGLGESIFLSFFGSYQKTFNDIKDPTHISLLNAGLRGAAHASVPAPSVLWGLISFVGFGLFSQYRKISA